MQVILEPNSCQGAPNLKHSRSFKQMPVNARVYLEYLLFPQRYAINTKNITRSEQFQFLIKQS
jgi:hypothetical protein